MSYKNGDEHEFPSFEEVSKRGNYWGVWGAPGSEAEGRGMLNLLTPANTLRAVREVTIGKSAGLNWDLRELNPVGLGRAPFKHDVVPLKGFPAFDDVYTFNPQQGSQWDGFRHWPSSVTGKFFEDLPRDDILLSSGSRLGLSHWAKQGITGRGVLLDYALWSEKKGVKYDAFSEHIVTVDDLDAVAKDQGVELKRGDILLIRTGVVREWNNMAMERKQGYADHGLPHTGLESSEKSVRWLWDHHFAAVAGDAISFEYFPFKTTEWRLHDFLLAQWGTPIGELFDLEYLSELCAKHNKWSFLFVSAPFNLGCGVSSVPNAVATL